MTVVAQQVLEPNNARFHAGSDLILRLQHKPAIEIRPPPDNALPRDTRARIPNVAKFVLVTWFLRSGFLPWFTPDRVYEIDTAGLTSPVLERRQWHHLPRPVYPLDEDAVWAGQ